MLRDAATLILFKKDENGLRVLMGLRNAGHKFMPNRLVFPGGGVDPEDYYARTASALPAGALGRLKRGATPALALALGHAAARELEEETGLTLGCPPELAGLDYLCRAETPEDYTIRFNARFFVGPASLVSGSIGGSGELEAVDWYALESLLQLDVPGATRQALVQLQRWIDVDEPPDANRRVPVLRNKIWIEE